MPLPVLPSKLVWERVRVEFDFSDQLEFNETISSWFVQAFPQSGVDPFSNDLIATRRFLDGAKAFQWIIGGVPGVVYRLTGTAVTSLGRVCKLEKTLAVLPNSQVIPPLFGVTYTTTPYPIEDIQNINYESLLIGSLFLTPPQDIIDYTSIPLSGSLRSPLATYSYTEAFNYSSMPTGGALTTPLISYSMRPEGFDYIAIPLAGSIKVVLVSYSMLPEGFNYSSIPVSGSLT